MNFFFSIGKKISSPQECSKKTPSSEERAEAEKRRLRRTGAASIQDKPPLFTEGGKEGERPLPYSLSRHLAQAESSQESDELSPQVRFRGNFLFFFFLRGKFFCFLFFSLFYNCNFFSTFFIMLPENFLLFFLTRYFLLLIM